MMEKIELLADIPITDMLRVTTLANPTTANIAKVLPGYSDEQIAAISKMLHGRMPEPTPPPEPEPEPVGVEKQATEDDWDSQIAAAVAEKQRKHRTVNPSDFVPSLKPEVLAPYAWGASNEAVGQLSVVLEGEDTRHAFEQEPRDAGRQHDADVPVVGAHGVAPHDGEEQHQREHHVFGQTQDLAERLDPQQSDGDQHELGDQGDREDTVDHLAVLLKDHRAGLKAVHDHGAQHDGGDGIAGDAEDQGGDPGAADRRVVGACRGEPRWWQRA